VAEKEEWVQILKVEGQPIDSMMRPESTPDRQALAWVASVQIANR